MASKTDKKIRKIITSQFGELAIEQKHVFKFSDGIFGFEDLNEYILIGEEETLPFRWLISIDKPEIGFPLLSPWYIDLEYEPGNDVDLDKQVVFVIITLENEDGDMAANLKAPIVLVVTDQTGKQVILPSDKYSVSYIFPKAKQ
jgi:flagellar assembly factor FliW